MADFKRLAVWQKAHALALLTDGISASIRSARHSSLRSQMCRAALSIPTNIVEGRGQKSDREFARFLRYSLNSASELEYHLIVARDASAITESQFLSATSSTIEVRKMLHGLLAAIDRKTPVAP